MKQERKFMFVGDPKDYHWDKNPIHGEKYTIDDLDMPEAIKQFPEEWEEVTEQEEKPRFKFIGDPGKYGIIKKFEILPYGFHPSEWDKPVEFYAGMYPEDWEIVEDEPTWIFEPANQDQPASSMTKFEKCVIDIIGNIYSNINIKTQTPTYQEISQIAINQAKETFKQLENLKK